MQQQEWSTLNDSSSASLYSRYARRVFAYLRNHKISREDAEDILLDVFLAALQQAKFVMLSEPEQLAWLQRVAHNKVVDLYRHSTHYPQIPLAHAAESVDEDESAMPEQRALQEEEYMRLRARLKNLSQLQQEVLRLRFTENLRCAAIAARIGKSEVAVRILLSRTLNQLRNTYEDQ